MVSEEAIEVIPNFFKSPAMLGSMLHPQAGYHQLGDKKLFPLHTVACYTFMFGAIGKVQPAPMSGNDRKDCIAILYRGAIPQVRLMALFCQRACVSLANERLVMPFILNFSVVE